MFTKYELEILRDAMMDYSLHWEEMKDRGTDISERFSETLESLEEKIDKLLEETE